MRSRMLLRRPAPRNGLVVRTVVGGGQLGHVPALVPALGHLLAFVAGQQAPAEGTDLAAGVVHVVLAADHMAAPGEHTGQSVAVASPPAVADVDGPGRIGRDELDLYLLPVADIGAGVPLLPLNQHGGKGIVQPAVIQTEVDKTGTCDLDGDHVIGQVPLQSSDDRRGQGPGIGARLLGRDHGHVGGPVPCSRLAGRSRCTRPGDGEVQAHFSGSRRQQRRPRRRPTGHESAGIRLGRGGVVVGSGHRGPRIRGHSPIPRDDHREAPEYRPRRWQ